MEKGDKLIRKIKKVSQEIAKLSAHEDTHNNWWGMDTDIGDLPFEIQKKLSKFIDWYEVNAHK